MGIWSWFINKLSLICQCLLIKYKGYRFDNDAKNAIKDKTNRQTLFKILKQNQNTKFLIDQQKKSNINIEYTIENFQKLFPKFTKYEDYKSYVDEIKNDGYTKDIMSIGFPIALTNTSGTSGDPKNFPV